MAEPIEPPASSAHRPFLEFRPLLRALGIASDARKLILATVGLVLFYAGRFAVEGMFNPPKPGLPSSLPGVIFEGPRLAPITSLSEAAGHVSDVYLTIVAPFARMFTRGVGPVGWFRSALVALWAATVWGIVGGAMARIAVVQAAIDRKIGLRKALRFAIGKVGGLIGAPLIPTLAVAFLAVGCALFGVIYRIPAVGGVVASILGFVPIALGLLMALVLVGLALGWPLMHATIAAEGEDAPDALSRSYSYVNQRLARYAAHVAASLAIGSLGLLAVMAFARVVVSLADWGVALGAPDLENSGESARFGRSFWDRFVGLVVLAWAYSYFWSSASIIYLILRRDVDGTAWHDVYLPEHDADTFDDGPGPCPVTRGSKAVDDAEAIER